MPKKLVIVESPSKAKTIKNFLGDDYTVLASVGHIRDLAESKSELPKEKQKEWWADYSVDVENGFEPYYVVPKEKTDQVRKLKEALKNADSLVLATDEDREGESISWHLLEVLKPTKSKEVSRIAFHEITKDAILEALKNPRQVDQHLVRAQEARRILDRLYGYSLSPVLWRLGKGRGLSAGRVQSPAVKLIVMRERERAEFVSSEYWDLKAQFKTKDGVYEGTLVEINGERILTGKDFDEKTGQPKDSKRPWLKAEDAATLAERAKASKPYSVAQVDTKPELRKPYAPFMTSTLQQEANRKLGFAADRTMRAAQDLYEGNEAWGIEGGLITYMRTDSVNLSAQAVRSARELIEKQYGEEYLPAKPNVYSSKVNNAQEAHEAIRPTNLALTPEMVAKALSKTGKHGDHIKLYELIWKRAIASQMRPAEILITSVKTETKTSEGETLTFSSSGKTIKFAGFLRAYVEGSDDPESALEDQEKLLPPVQKGQEVVLDELKALEHHTKPPARYTEASLVKALEERGIGRPSTYATILRTIVDREYVRKSGKELVPTFMAYLVTKVLEEHFAEFSELDFTAGMDRVLDEIANGKEDWKVYLKRFFYGDNSHPGLKPLVDERSKDIKRPAFLVGEHEGVPVTIQFGRNGFFLVKGDMESGATASIPEDLAPADLTLEKAIELLENKTKVIGVDPVTGRNLIVKNRGGYYLETERTQEEIEGKVKPRWISVPPGVNPVDLDKETLEALCMLPKDLGEEIFVKMGKFGAYLEQGSERRTISDWKKALEITLEEAKEILSMPKEAARRASGPKVIAELGEHEGLAIKALEGRYGPYVSDGTVHATLPKGTDPASVTLEKAIELLNEKKAAGPSKKKRVVRRKK
jgi:DNA topoisomerase-1